MGVIEAIILGIIQGLTEFLPVSSSGHIELGKEILGVEVSDPLMFSLVVHAATALSTIVIFRKDIVQIFKGLFKFTWNDDVKFAAMIVVSMMPAAIVGIFFEDHIDAFFTGNILLVGMMLLVTGFLLFAADRAKVSEKKVTTGRAVLIGISQAIAILPGVSRSGATISTAVLLGIDKGRAARFSFLMVVPLILGAAVLDMKKFKDESKLAQMETVARTEAICAELLEDEVITDAQVADANRIILGKEKGWDQAVVKASGLDQDALLNQVGLVTWFDVNLKGSFDDATVTAIMTHDAAKVRAVSGIGMLALITGFFAAFLVGMVACTWMIKLVKRSKLTYFSIYCFVVGTIAIITSL